MHACIYCMRAFCANCTYIFMLYSNHAYVYILHTPSYNYMSFFHMSTDRYVDILVLHSCNFVPFFGCYTQDPLPRKSLDPRSRTSGVAMGPCHQCRSTLPLRRVGFNVSAMANTFDVGFQALFCNHQRQGKVMPEHRHTTAWEVAPVLVSWPHFSAAQLVQAGSSSKSYSP